jgi:hypothetical protein
MSDRNFWSCPTCHFQYRLERLRWGRWLTSWWARGFVTLFIMLVTVFLLGFIADPIIDLWLDPFGSIADTLIDVVNDIEALDDLELDEPSTWSFHFLKGFFSLGLLGFLKSFFAMGSWQWFNFRHGGVFGGRRRGGTGRDRLNNISWVVLIIGVFTFMGVSALDSVSLWLDPVSG